MKFKSGDRVLCLEVWAVPSMKNYIGVVTHGKITSTRDTDLIMVDLNKAGNFWIEKEKMVLIKDLTKLECALYGVENNG